METLLLIRPFWLASTGPQLVHYGFVNWRAFLPAAISMAQAMQWRCAFSLVGVLGCIGTERFVFGNGNLLSKSEMYCLNPTSVESYWWAMTDTGPSASPIVNV
jgi:hypothetical protein